MKELFLCKNIAFFAMFVRRTYFDSGRLLDIRNFIFRFGSPFRQPSEKSLFRKNISKASQSYVNVLKFLSDRLKFFFQFFFLFFCFFSRFHINCGRVFTAQFIKDRS